MSWAELADGCVEMSKQGILHRDLTLDNILVTLDPGSSGKVSMKISDFGVSATSSDY